MENEDKKDWGKTIRVGKKETPIEKYVYAILKALLPHNYENYGFIRITAKENTLQKAEYIIKLFEELKILTEEKREKKKTIIEKEDGESYPLEIIEIILKKHPHLR